MQKTFTKDAIADIATEIVATLTPGAAATVVALSGDLGAGKTTLTQAVAEKLGVHETVISPTFVIMKVYELAPNARSHGFERLIHIDAYRLKSADELTKLGWHELLTEPKNLILIEWPERVEGLIPTDAHIVSLSHDGEETRNISHTF